MEPPGLQGCWEGIITFSVPSLLQNFNCGHEVQEPSPSHFDNVCGILGRHAMPVQELQGLALPQVLQLNGPSLATSRLSCQG
jgi:hypothetical protein